MLRVTPVLVVFDCKLRRFRPCCDDKFFGKQYVCRGRPGRFALRIEPVPQSPRLALFSSLCRQMF